MEEKEFLELLIINDTQLAKLQGCNQYTEKFSLKLSQQEALTLLKDRAEVLKEQQRVEFGEGILEKLIFTFCDSPYIYQDNYVETIGKLQEIFFLYKNESLDELTDDELLTYMKEQFEGACQGSLEHLEDTALEGFARAIRKGATGFIGSCREDEDEL